MTLSSPSLFDVVTFRVSINDNFDVFDANGFVFKARIGVLTYRLPFNISLYDTVNDTLTHNIYSNTDMYGSTTATVMANNELWKNRSIETYITTNISGNTNINDDANIRIVPVESDITFTYANESNLPDIVKEFYLRDHENLTIVSGGFPLFQSIQVVSGELFESMSGIIPTGSKTPIIDMYHIGDTYAIHHTSLPELSTLVFDMVVENATILNYGDTYGTN
jgi:hypothetical protein